MEMDADKYLICAASVYKKSYYFNPDFNKLPSAVKDEIREICLYFAQKLHCVFSVRFKENGDVYFETAAHEWDMDFDEIGAKLDLDSLAKQRQDFFNSLKVWYKVFGNGA